MQREMKKEETQRGSRKWRETDDKTLSVEEDDKAGSPERGDEAGA